MEGFCALDVKPFGPVQRYVAPATVEAKRLSVPSAQIGPLFAATGGDGAGLIVRRLFPVADCPSGSVIVTFFAPGMAAVVSRLSETWVMSVKAAAFTITPPDTDPA